jgi:hypothetical protein
VAQGEAKDPSAGDRIFDFKARWRKEEIYSEADFGVISDPKKLLKFVSEATTATRPLHSSSTELPLKRFSERIYGTTFDKQVLDGKRDALIMIEHPIKEKNRGLMEKFE